MKRTLLLLLLAIAFPAFGAATFTPAPRGINPTQYDNSGSIKSGATLTNLVFRQSSGNALTVNTNVLLVSTNSVGIGTAFPLRPLHVGNAAVAGAVDTKILVAAIIDNTGSGNSHAFTDASQIGRSGGIGYNSFYAQANLAGGVDYDHYAAFQSSPENVSVGILKSYFGHFDTLSVQGGTVKTNAAFYAQKSFLFGGVIENNFGLYVADHTNGTVGNFGVYTDGTVGSTFGGAVKVGQLKFSATASGAADAGITRYGADVLEVNNGTTGHRRELMLRALWDSGGNQVVGSRQAAVADATDAASAITQLNDLLAKLRTHGLIAP